MKQRKFFIGDQWLYLKVYSGPQMLEEILLNEIPLIVEKLTAKKRIEKFFFIRFFDDGHHLRFRFLIAKNKHIQSIIDAFNERLSPLMSDRLVSRITVDTYNQEIERYGRKSINDVESLFNYNSEIILKALHNFQNEQDKWIWGMCHIYKFLKIFELSDNYIQQIFESHYQSLCSEFGSTKYMKIYLDTTFRKHRSTIDEEFYKTDSLAVHEEPHSDYQLAVKNILHLKSTDALEVPFDSLMKSLIHMHFNRLFKTQAREQEFVLSYFLSKQIKSKLARTKSVVN